MLFNQAPLKSAIAKKWGLDPFKFENLGPIDLLILQPTPFCNLACEYCYLTTKDDKSRMSEDTLRTTLKRVFDSGLIKDQFTIVWHAGEPTAPGLNYYKEAYRIIEELTPPGINVTSTFQTNATLLNDEWCDFIKTKNIRIGVSIDGPKQINDIYRKTRSGRGAFDRTIKGINTLNRNGVDFYTISVVTKEALGSAKEYFEFFKSLGVRTVCFNIEENEVQNTSSFITNRGNETLISDFFETFYDLNEISDVKMEVREFRAATLALLAARPHARSLVGYGQENWPFKITNVAYNGDISTYSPEMLGVETKDYGSFVFGNVHENELKDILQNETFRSVTRDIRSGVKRCRKECRYFSLCGGGTPANKYYENGSFSSTETAYCRIHKMMPLNLVMNKLETKLSQIGRAHV